MKVPGKKAARVKASKRVSQEEKRTGFQTEKRKKCKKQKKNSSSDFAGESERKLFQRRASLHKILFTVYEKNGRVCVFSWKRSITFVLRFLI